MSGTSNSWCTYLPHRYLKPNKPKVFMIVPLKPVLPSVFHIIPVAQDKNLNSFLSYPKSNLKANPLKYILEKNLFLPCSLTVLTIAAGINLLKLKSDYCPSAQSPSMALQLSLSKSQNPIHGRDGPTMSTLYPLSPHLIPP